jgi:hypothetical protein
MSLQERLVVTATFLVAAAASGQTQNPAPAAPTAPAASAPSTAPAASTDSAPAGTAAPAVPDGIAGRWRFNVNQSDDARKKMEDARAEHGGEGGGRWGGGGGGGGFGGHGGGGGGGRWGGGGHGGGGGRWGGGDGDSSSTNTQRPGMQSLFEPASEITISDSQSEITILEKDGVIRVLHPDGDKHKTDNGMGEVKTHRDKGKLIVETTNARGGKMTETIALSNNHKQLTNDIHLQGRFGNVDIRRVYDSIPPE